MLDSGPYVFTKMMWILGHISRLHNGTGKDAFDAKSRDLRRHCKMDLKLLFANRRLQQMLLSGGPALLTVLDRRF
jgi:hypothetical protein